MSLKQPSVKRIDASAKLAWAANFTKEYMRQFSINELISMEKENIKLFKEKEALLKTVKILINLMDSLNLNKSQKMVILEAKKEILKDFT